MKIYGEKAIQGNAKEFIASACGRGFSR